jgi:hypothetical protein
MRDVSRGIRTERAFRQVLRFRPNPRWRKNGSVTYIKSDEASRYDEQPGSGEVEEEADVMVDQCGEKCVGEMLSTDFAALRARSLVVQGLIMV